jgi:hypothetical protein
MKNKENKKNELNSLEMIPIQPLSRENGFSLRYHKNNSLGVLYYYYLTQKGCRHDS